MLLVVTVKLGRMTSLGGLKNKSPLQQRSPCSIRGCGRSVRTNTSSTVHKRREGTQVRVHWEYRNCSDTAVDGAKNIHLVPETKNNGVMTLGAWLLCAIHTAKRKTRTNPYDSRGD